MFHTLRSYFNTAVSDLRYQGVPVLLWRVLVKVLMPVVRIDAQILFDLDLTQPVKVRKARVACVVAPVTQDDIDEVLEMQMPVPVVEPGRKLTDHEEMQLAQLQRARVLAHQAYARQLRAGEVCYVARVDGRIAHSNWIRYHDNEEVDGRPVELRAGEVYTTDGFTAEDLRGLGLHEEVATSMLLAAKEAGCHRAYTITDMTKGGSRRGVRRIGWRRRGTTLYVTPRGVRRTWLFGLAGDVEPIFTHARKVTSPR